VHLIVRSQSTMDGLMPLYWELVNFPIPVFLAISIERVLRLAKAMFSSLLLTTLNSRST